MNRILAIFLISLAVSCNDDDCSSIACTTEYRLISVSLVDSEGNAVILDSYTVVRSDTREALSFDTDVAEFNQEGQYSIAEDQHFDQIAREGTSFIFEGIINNEVVISENFLIGNDCCHVVKLEGPDSLTVDI